MLRFDRIEALMKLNNLTQTELLARAGQSVNNFSRWKSGKSNPSWSSITSIANVLGVMPEYLTGTSDSPYGGDIVEKGTEMLMDAGADVESFDDDNGVGQQYVVVYNGISTNYDSRGYQDLCRQVLTAANDSELAAVIRFCKQNFLGMSGVVEEETAPYYDFTKEEIEFIKKYRQLDSDGKIMLQSALISELRRK